MYADCTRTANKKTALLLTKDGCRACEIIVRKWNDYYSNSDLQVLPINTSLKENELFNKLSQNYAFPLIIIIDDSLIVHGVIAGIKDKKNIAAGIERAIQGKFTSNFSNSLNIEDVKYQKVLSSMFRAQYFFEKHLFSRSLLILRELNQETPFFYSLYLQAVIEQKIGKSIFAKEIADKSLLFINPLFEFIYRTNIKEMREIAQHTTSNVLQKDSILYGSISNTYIYNLGTINKGKKQVFTIKFKNSDTLSLNIVDITSSCHCIIGKWVKKPIHVGNVSEIMIEYSPQCQGDFSNVLMLRIINANGVEKGIPILIRGYIKDTN